MEKKKIIYVNFAPYDNTGRFLDYLVMKYSLVVHFSFDHLRLKNGRRSRLTIYKNGEKVAEKKLLWLRTHPLLLFPSLPFVALAMFAETLMYTRAIAKAAGKFDLFITVNAYPAATGVILKKLGYVKKTVFWVWDYFPTNFPDWRLNLIRKGYLFFDKQALSYSDKIVFLNRYLKNSREKIHTLPSNKPYSIIPIGTLPVEKLSKHEKIIGHMGLIKESQGLDLLFDNLEEFFQLFPGYKIEVIGSGPEEERYRRKARKYGSKIKFYGFMENPEEIDNIIKKWQLGLATYIPVPWSEHYWGDPSKIKAYIANGVPVVVTNVPEFAKIIMKNKAGILIKYDKKELFNAIKELISKNNAFSKNARVLSVKFDYRKIYRELLK